MGQVWGNLMNTFKSKIPEERVVAITDAIFVRIMEDAKKKAQAADPKAQVADKNTLTFAEMHFAIVQVFEELNNRIPGAKYDPPSEEKVREMLKDFDNNEDQLIDREEFSKFVPQFTVDIVRTYAKELLIVTVAVPAAAMVTKRASRNIPMVGNVIAKVPTTVFVGGVTSAFVIFQNIFKNQH